MSYGVFVGAESVRGAYLLNNFPTISHNGVSCLLLVYLGVFSEK
jgi:hypothetical protein